MVEINEIKSEERLTPIIRARLAEKLSHEGLRVSEIASALKVTQSAVTQYLKSKRGKSSITFRHLDEIVDPLSEKLARKIRSGQGGLETSELLETARQLLVLNRAGSVPVYEMSASEDKNRAAVELLRQRLKLELKAAEKYLELANEASDEHTKMLLRLIASDSIRHGDIVSQIISWLEIGGAKGQFQSLERHVLEQMISLEDSASEVNLSRSVKTGHPIARLLLEWIDRDEEKHEKILTKVLSLR